MTEFIYGLGDLFTASFEILPVVGGYANVIVATVLAVCLFKAFRVAVTEEYKGA